MNQKYSRTEIIKAGEILFRSNGFKNTGLKDILMSTGISKGAFYNQFSSKDDFAREVVEYYGTITRRMINSKLQDPELSPLGRIEKFYSYLTEINQKESFKNGCLVNNFSLELGGLDKDLASLVNYEFKSWTDIISKTIAEGQEYGEITKKLSSTDLANNIHTVFFGFLTRAKVIRNRKPLDTALDLIINMLKK